jgi:cytochrome P450
MAETPAPEFPMARRCPFDPPPELSRIQHRQAPVARVKIWDGSTPWVITRYDDVRAVLADPRVSSDTGLAGFPSPSDGLAARRQHAKTFINMDDPEHAAQRRLLTSDFMIKKIEGMRPQIQQITDDLIDEMLAGPKPADLVDTLALPLPSLVICRLLGVPYADHAFFESRTRTMVTQTGAPETGRAASEEIRSYLSALITEAERRPGDDLIGRLVTERRATGELSHEALTAMALLLLVAGHETTANMIPLGVLTLLENPGALDASRADPALWPGVVEELLRYHTVVDWAGGDRMAIEDLEIGGRLVRAGDGIFVLNAAANRDEHAFPAPDTFDVRRAARHHLAFGYGIHQCLGQNLARAELEIAYETLFRRLPGLRLTEPVEELPFKYDSAIFGVRRLPLAW